MGLCPGRHPNTRRNAWGRVESKCLTGDLDRIPLLVSHTYFTSSILSLKALLS